MNFRNQYSFRDEHRTGWSSDKPSRTKQSFIDECDINSIMARYASGMGITHVNTAEPIYADVSNAPADYASAFDMIQNAQKAFENLPSGIRKALDFNPANLEMFISNPANRQVCIDNGLLRDVEPISKVEPISNVEVKDING